MFPKKAIASVTMVGQWRTWLQREGALLFLTDQRLNDRDVNDPAWHQRGSQCVQLCTRQCRVHM